MTTVHLRSPYDDALAGVLHLARFADKARLQLAGALPRENAAVFGSRLGVDGAFLRHFGLTLPAFLEAVAAAADDDALSAWFRAHTDEAQRAAWNEVAVRLGRPGYPMRLVWMVTRLLLLPFSRAARQACVLDAIEVDEGRPPRGPQRPGAPS